MALVSAIPGQGDGRFCFGLVESRRSFSDSIHAPPTTGWNSWPRFRACLRSKSRARWRSLRTPSTYSTGSRNGSPSGSGGIGGGKMSRSANADLWIELDELAALHKTTWVWTRGHAGHEDNTRCDWLAQNAAATQRSSWADGRPHAPLRLGLGADYVPPKPQASLFDDVEPAGEDDQDDGEALQEFG